jgi:hypothetical protein
MKPLKKWKVYVISEDYFMKSILRFQAYTAVMCTEKKNRIWIDGRSFDFEDGFEGLKEEKNAASK